MAKLNREAAVRERRQRKKIRKDARKQAALDGTLLDEDTASQDNDTPGLADGTPGLADGTPGLADGTAETARTD